MDRTDRWAWPMRVAFRFAFVYFALYMTTGVPLFSAPFRKVVAYVATPILRGISSGAIELSAAGTSLGNDFGMAMAAMLFAMVMTPAWCFVERSGKYDARLHLWLRWAIRYFVLITMVIYGAAKVIQFGEVPPSQMLEPIGSLTPMRLLWLFMGASKMYSLFAGACEVTGGLLLISRRTTTLGALVCAAVMSNVWLMNMLYDVPVKVLSFHLLLMSIFLVLPDLRRVLNVFILNRATAPAEEPPMFTSPALARMGNALLILLVAGVVVFAVVLVRMSGKEIPISPLQGVWFVAEFETDGIERLPLVTDTNRWHRVIVDRPQVMAIQKMDSTMDRFGMTLDAQSKTLNLTKPGEPRWKAELTFDNLPPRNSELSLEGTIDGARVRAKLRKEPLPDFPLARRAY